MELLSWRSLRTFAAMLLVALLKGISLAEIFIRADEAAFVREVNAVTAGGNLHAYNRARAGWADFARLDYDPAAGFSATAPFDHPRIAGFRARDTTEN